MKATEVLRTALQSTQMILTTYLSDLSDEEMLERPADGANHIAWQLGHLISAEQSLISTEVENVGYPELPEEFVEKHKPSDAGSTEGFWSKSDYLKLFNDTRAHTIEVVQSLTDDQLDEPTKGTMAKFAPTLGAICVLVSDHTLMHAGQFAVLRRRLGKPILI